MNFTYHEGDLIASDEPIIAHGCNTVGAMGAGIAAQIAAKYPMVREVYGDACTRGVFCLGTAQPVSVKMHGWVPGKRDLRTVYNLGTQLIPGPDARYDAIALAFANMASHMWQQGQNRVAIPRIGCGIGGLEWDGVLAAMIRGVSYTELRSMNVAVYDFVPPSQRPIRKSAARSGLDQLVFDGGVGL